MTETDFVRAADERGVLRFVSRRKDAPSAAAQELLAVSRRSSRNISTRGLRSEAGRRHERDARPVIVFLTLFRDGTERQFTAESNARWLAETRPVVEAFFHARFFLEMAIRYGAKLDDTPKALPSGYAALLHLYNLR